MFFFCNAKFEYEIIKTHIEFLIFIVANELFLYCAEFVLSQFDA